MKKIFSKIRDPKILRVIIAALIISVIVGGFLYYQKTINRVIIENSLISAPVINVMPSHPGRLSELDAVEGYTVKSGDTLAVVGGETLRAQSAGLIILASDQVGGTIGVQSPFIQMIKTQDLRVAGTIDENKGLNDIKVGQIASFTVDALPGKTFWGYVDEISPSAKQTQLSFSISSERPTQQFEVYVKYDSFSYPQIKNGMSAKMTVYTK